MILTHYVGQFSFVKERQPSLIVEKLLIMNPNYLVIALKMEIIQRSGD